MTINARRVAERVIARIRSSEYRLTIYYPKLQAKPVGTDPIALPTSPLVARPNPQRETGDEPERVLSDITVPCLYLESSQLGDLRSVKMEAALAGWSQQFTALARVVASDVDRPEGGTAFEGCAFVEILGSRYKVLGVVRQSASTTSLGTYYVLLKGASKE
jgi:hypothetical protein